MHRRQLVVLAAWVLAAVSMIAIAPNLEGPPGALITLPVLVTAWVYGLRGAGWAAALSLPTSVISIGVATGDFIGVLTSPAVLLGHAVTAMIGVVLGYSRTLRTQLADETERRAAAERERLAAEMEARLLRADRLVTLGTLAASVAHEVNNPLTYVLSSLDLAVDELRALPVPERSRLEAVLEHLEQAELGAVRIERRVSDLLQFARDQPERFEPVQLATVVQQAARLAQHQVPRGVSLSLDLVDSAQVEGDAAKLEQVVVNLVINACHAVDDGRGTSVSVAVNHDADTASVVVTDDGPGIPEGVRQRIFEPFFTTKPVGEGTGLGLSICATIAEKHGGELIVEDAEGEGTTVILRLPRATAARAEATTASAPEPRSGSPRSREPSDG